MQKPFFNPHQPFPEAAIAMFHWQYSHHPVYRKWCSMFGIRPSEISFPEQIPFLPVSLFKTLTVGDNSSATVFESSGTSGMVTSRHYVPDITLYEKAFMSGFREQYGNPGDYVILGLLPAYLERPNSSLVYMVDSLIRESNHPESGFFLYDHQRLFRTLLQMKEAKRKVILFGVTFALLDFAQSFELSFPELIIIETGGMKGRRKEMTRMELHQILTSSFGVSDIHSEYGMTEMLSQAYCSGGGIFRPSSTMKVWVREAEDPLTIKSSGRGLINVIDLANIDSCAFIATDDIGVLYKDGRFEVQGRADHSDLRGCNLLLG